MLDYSSDAKNILSKFHQVDQILYVEGDDDVPFWETVFEKLSSLKIAVRQVGGKEELERHIQKIISGELFDVVAMDTDFDLLNATCIDHPRVLRTAGYSIENSLITAEALVKITRRAGKISASDAPEKEFRNWLDEFTTKTQCLIVNDLINRRNGHGIRVLCDSCDRFMVSKTCSSISEAIVNQHLEALGLDSKSELPDEVSVILESEAVPLSDFIRGHFLFSAAFRCVSIFIKRRRPKLSFSHAAFLGSLILVFDGALDSGGHPHFMHYKTSIQRLEEAA